MSAKVTNASDVLFKGGEGNIIAWNICWERERNVTVGMIRWQKCED